MPHAPVTDSHSEGFAPLGLSKPLLGMLASRGYEKPTPIQAKTIPAILEGRDILGCAQTGTGKTAAFALPILDLLTLRPPARAKGQRRSPRAIILSPTRELAGQIEKSFETYGQRSKLRNAVIYGGVKQHRQVQQLQSGVDIIVATPGRLLDLMEQGYVDLRAIEIFVLDEADQMLDMGFIDPIRKVASAIPSNHQTLLFSATMPANIKKLADSLLNNPVHVAVNPVASAAPLIEQSLYQVTGEAKPTLLAHLLRAGDVTRALVFTRTKHGADKLTKKLVRDGIQADAIHGNKSQAQRQRALTAFRTGKVRVLVATDVAARGLDISAVSHVFNFNLPNEPEAYVHRIGRTGRAGKTGIAISFCSREERNFLRSIEKLIGTTMEVTELPEDLGPVTSSEGFCATNENPRPQQRSGRGSRSNNGSTTPRNEQRPAPRSGPRSGPRSAPRSAPRSDNRPPRARTQGQASSGGDNYTDYGAGSGSGSGSGYRSGSASGSGSGSGSGRRPVKTNSGAGGNSGGGGGGAAKPSRPKRTYNADARSEGFEAKPAPRSGPRRPKKAAGNAQSARVRKARSS